MRKLLRMAWFLSLVISSLHVQPLLASNQFQTQSPYPAMSYTNRWGGYSLILSSDWQKLSEPEAYSACLFKVKSIEFPASAQQPTIWGWALSDAHHRNYWATLSCTFFPTNTNSALDTSFVEILSAMKSRFTNFKVLEEGGFPLINGKPAKRALVSFQKDGVAIKHVLYLIQNNGINYLITGTTLANDFEIYRPQIEAACHTFKLR